MKNYTLSLDLFNESDEFYSSIDILNENFEGLINTDNFFRLHGMTAQKTKLSVLLAFNEIINRKDDKNSRESVTSRIYNGKGTGNNEGREALLAQFASVSEQFLLDNNVNVEEAVSLGHLVEVNFIHFTPDETLKLVAMINRRDTGLDGESYETILLKLKGLYNAR